MEGACCNFCQSNRQDTSQGRREGRTRGHAVYWSRHVHGLLTGRHVHRLRHGHGHAALHRHAVHRRRACSAATKHSIIAIRKALASTSCHFFSSNATSLLGFLHYATAQVDMTTQGSPSIAHASFRSVMTQATASPECPGGSMRPVPVRRVLRLQGRPVPAAHASAAHRLQGTAAVAAKLTAAACG